MDRISHPQHLPESCAVLGGDVGWSETKRTSAACCLEFDGGEVRVVVARSTARPDELKHMLADVAGHRPLLAAAFDGPFRRGLDEIGRYRICERVLTVGLARHIGKPGQSNVPNGRKLNAAANAFVKTALSVCRIARAGHRAGVHTKAVAEAFPTSFMGVMLERDQVGREGARPRSDSYYERLTTHPRGDRLAGLIARLLPGRELQTPLSSLTNHDNRAAVVCAITALCVAARRYVAVGDKDGYIILPPPAGHGECVLQPWALEIVRANTARMPATRLIIED